MVSSVAFSPDGTRIASSSGDKTIKVWDAASGQELTTLSGHTRRVQSVAFSPDGTRIVSGSIDKTIKVWDAASGQELTTLSGHTKTVQSVAFSPDGTRIASSSHERDDQGVGRRQRPRANHPQWAYEKGTAASPSVPTAPASLRAAMTRRSRCGMPPAAKS